MEALTIDRIKFNLRSINIKLNALVKTARNKRSRRQESADSERHRDLTRRKKALENKLSELNTVI